MLGDALRFPFAGDDGTKSLLLGGVMLLLGFLVLPALVAQGYFVRVLRAAVAGDDEAPAFDDWVDLLVDGLQLLVIALAYVIVPTMLLMMVATVVLVGGAAYAADSPGVALGTLGVVGGLILAGALLLLLLAAYLLPAATANFARHDNIAAAFDLGTVVDAAFSTDYLVAAVLAFVVGVGVGILSLVLAVLTFGLFLFLLAFVQFYVQVVVYHLFGRGFARALSLDEGRSATATVE